MTVRGRLCREIDAVDADEPSLLRAAYNLGADGAANVAAGSGSAG